VLPILAIGLSLVLPQAALAVAPVALSRSFPRAGAYRVGLRVVDRDDAASVSFRTIRVGRRGAARAALLSPFPVVRMVSTLIPTGVRLRLLTVRAPRGAEVTLRCRGRDCPYRRKSKEFAGVASGSPGSSAPFVRAT
jgi:hypothetical protein